MCEYTGKLVAWLDRELSDGEMAKIELHLGDCAECRKLVGSYEHVSNSFDAYCESVMEAGAPRRRSRWVPLVSAAGAAALAASLILFLAYPRIAPVPALPPMAAAAAATVIEPAPAPEPSKTIHRQHPVARVQAQVADWLPTEPAIQIAIPADSMFPPGAVPPGINFTADVSFGPDGTAQQIQLRPRLIAFEKGGSQP